MAKLANMSNMSVDEMALYDRQIRLWGLDAQNRMRQAHVLVVGMTGLTNELCKNIVLAGIGSVTLIDHEIVTLRDLGCQFLLREDDVGKNRAKAVLPRMSNLNPRVKIAALAENVEEKPDVFFSGFHLVVVGKHIKKSALTRINQACRKSNVKFISSLSFGLFGYIFSDLCNYTYVEERNDGTNVKRIQKTIAFTDFKTANAKNWTGSRPRVIKRLPPLYIGLELLWEFEDSHNHWPMKSSPEDAEALRQCITSFCSRAGLDPDMIGDKIMTRELTDVLVQQCQIEIGPVAAIVGGVLAQEVLNAVAGKEVSVDNLFCFSALHGGDGRVIRI